MTIRPTLSNHIITFTINHSKCLIKDKHWVINTLYSGSTIVVTISVWNALPAVLHLQGQGQTLDVTTLLIICSFVFWLINHRRHHDLTVPIPSIHPSSPTQKPRKKLADTSVASNSESGSSSDSSSDGSLSSDLEDLAEDDEDDDDDDEEDEDEDKHSEFSDSEKRMKKKSKVRMRRTNQNALIFS